jgi:hypothetical protein
MYVVYKCPIRKWYFENLFLKLTKYKRKDFLNIVNKKPRIYWIIIIIT